MKAVVWLRYNGLLLFLQPLEKFNRTLYPWEFLPTNSLRNNGKAIRAPVRNYLLVKCAKKIHQLELNYLIMFPLIFLVKFRKRNQPENDIFRVLKDHSLLKTRACLTISQHQSHSFPFTCTRLGTSKLHCTIKIVVIFLCVFCIFKTIK